MEYIHLGTLLHSLFQIFILIIPTLPLVLAFPGFLLLIMSTKVNLFQLLKSTKKDTVKRTADRGTVIQTQTSEMQASEKLPTYEEIPKASKKNVMGKLEKEIKEAKKPEDLSCPPTFNRIGYCRQGLCLDTLRGVYILAPLIT